MWLYQDEEVTRENLPKPNTKDPEKAFIGFVYMMGAVIDGEKKFYIGKKTVYSPSQKKLNKTELGDPFFIGGSRAVGLLNDGNTLQCGIQDVAGFKGGLDFLVRGVTIKAEQL